MNDRIERDVWSVPADTTLQSLLDDPACPELLVRALKGIPSWQVRNETTVGKSLKASSLMPEWLAALLVLGAVVTVRGLEGAEFALQPIKGSAEESTGDDVPLEFLLDRSVNGEVSVLSIRRVNLLNSHWGEAHVARTEADEPIVAALATVRASAGTVEEARLALTGVWSEPVRLAEAAERLVGERLSADGIKAVAEALEQEVEPRTDYRGSAGYRRAMAGVLGRRALEACAAAVPAGGPDEE